MKDIRRAYINNVALITYFEVRYSLNQNILLVYILKGFSPMNIKRKKISVKHSMHLNL